MSDKILLIKDSSTTIDFHKKYMIVHAKEQNYVVGYRHIGELYLNKLIPITPRECIRIAKLCKLYFIDQHGYVLASFRLEHA